MTLAVGQNKPMRDAMAVDGSDTGTGFTGPLTVRSVPPDSFSIDYAT
ncbi:hypothetical protein [Nocardia amamiensis]